MTGLRNLLHLVGLGLWAVLGLALTMKGLFGMGPPLQGLMTSLSFWMWFLGFAGVTTFFVTRWTQPLSALWIHGLAFIVLCAIPRIFPLSLLRLGLDLVNR